MTESFQSRGPGRPESTPTPIRVGVLGAFGLMGTAVCKAVNAADDLDLVAQIGSGDALPRLLEARVEVVVDFTSADVVMSNLQWLIANRISVVVGTSGFDDVRLKRVESWLEQTVGVSVVVVQNFAVGIALMTEVARRIAPMFESVEIVETHHAEKEYAPSNTAKRLAEAVAEARAASNLAPMPDGTVSELPGVRGWRELGVHVHSLRARGMVAHHEAVFGLGDEVLTIRHDSHGGAFFMHGVLLAVRRVRRRPGITLGLAPLLE